VFILSLCHDLLAFLLSFTTLKLKNTFWTNAATWQQILADDTFIIKQVASNKASSLLKLQKKHYNYLRH
jgi:hypothetical protein